MSDLLKDRPEHAERIENNYLLGKEIEDCLEDAEFDEDWDSVKDNAVSGIVSALKGAEFAIDGNIVRIDDPELLAQSVMSAVMSACDGNLTGEVSNKPEIAAKIRESLTNFVNQNYQNKKDAAKEYDKGYEQGQVDYESENPPINEEKLCTEYVVEKFADCKTLSDFIEVFNELRNISYTHM